MTNLLQGHIENEIDLNGQASCRKSCEPYNFAKPQSCYKDLFCSKQPACNGKFLDSMILIHIHYGISGCGIFREGYKISKVFAKESTYSKEIIEF